MKTFFSILSFLIIQSLPAQDKYWQQDLSYKIDVELDDSKHTLKGFESIVYKNNSPSTLEYIWFHIWPKAYSNKKTALYKQLKRDNHRYTGSKYFSGDIDSLAFKVNGIQVATEPHAEHIDIIKVVLNKPLSPGDSIIISTPFIVKLPPYFSRSGYHDGQYVICQWYPKPAVFDKSGWHLFPYLDTGEYYSEFATYNVNITLPPAYIVAATGVLQNEEELEIYKTIGAENIKLKHNEPRLYMPGSINKKTLSWTAHNVPDFAWFADKEYVIHYDTVMLASGKVVDAFSYYHQKRRSQWINSVKYAEDALRHYSAWIGEYDYPVVNIVEGPLNSVAGGMEYPMITLITIPNAGPETLDIIITHEVGHNWFMSMIGNNERKHAWMDEGLNTFYEYRYSAIKYQGNAYVGRLLPQSVRHQGDQMILDYVYNILLEQGIEPAIDTPTEKFLNSADYMMVSYNKAALWLYMLENYIGRKRFDIAMQHYFRKWKFKHPQPEDMKTAFEEAIGQSLDSFFAMTKKTGKF